jgi:hypothetical protein
MVDFAPPSPPLPSAIRQVTPVGTVPLQFVRKLEQSFGILNKESRKRNAWHDFSNEQPKCLVSASVRCSMFKAIPLHEQIM